MTIYFFVFLEGYMKKIVAFFFVIMFLIFSINFLYAESLGYQKNKEQEESLINSKESQEEFIVKFKTSTTEDKKKAALSDFNIQKIGNEKLGMFKVSGRDNLNKTFKENMAKGNNDIEYIVPNYKRKINRIPNDYFYSEQWHLPSINVLNAWDLTTGSSNVTVAVLDSGIDLTHPDLQGKTVQGRNFLSPAIDINDIYDINGHGTFVSGIIGAITNNNIGISSVGWNIKIMPLQVLWYDGMGYDDAIISAIIYAVDHGAKVINMSFGGPDSSIAFQNAIDYATSHNVVVVAAVGNDSSSILNYPAAFNDVIGVGSVNSSLTKSSFSNYNSSVDIVAPGEDIISTGSTQLEDSTDYQIRDGTSFAAPQVSAIAGLVLSLHPGLSCAQVTDTIQLTSGDIGTIGRDNSYGYGLVNAAAALTGVNGPVKSLGLTTNPTSPQTAGTTITLTATANRTAEYQFFVMNPGESWAAVTGYSTSGTYSWTPQAVGSYGLGVRARAAGTSVMLDMDRIIYFEVTEATGPVTSLSLTTNPTSPQTAGTAITLTATANRTAEYQFFVMNPDGGWAAVTGYSTSNTYSWTPQAAGSYGLGVRARAAGTSVMLDMDRIIYFEVTEATGPVTSLSLTTNPTSPQTAGTAITLTATANRTAEYQFFVMNPDGGWAAVTGYSTSNTYSWTPQAAGSYGLGVRARAAGTSVMLDMDRIIYFEVTEEVDGPVTSLDLETDEMSPQPTGTTVILTATANRTAEYQFFVMNPDGGWAAVTGYSTSNTYSWTPQAAGSYGLGVRARAAGTSVMLDMDRIIYFEVTEATGPVTSLSLTTNPTSPQTAGTAITLTATANRTAEYQFFVMNPDGGWAAVTGYSTSNTYSWTPQAAGSYGLGVRARAAGTSVMLDMDRIIYFEVTEEVDGPVTSLDLETDEMSPQPTGTTVILTATANRTAEYQFFVMNPDGGWAAVTGYSTSNTYSWTPQAAGSYGLGVRARAAGTSVMLDMDRIIYFEVTEEVDGPVTSLDLETDEMSPQPTGTTVILTATANRTAEYQFFVMNPGGSWAAVTGYSTSSTYSWTPQAAGTYGLGVRARAAGTSVMLDMDRTVNFEVTEEALLNYD